MMCPFCHQESEPIVRIRELAICGKCGGSVYLSDREIRPSKYADLEELNDSEIAQLRRGRASIARADRPQR